MSSPYHADDALLLGIPAYFESLLSPLLPESNRHELGVEANIKDHIRVYTRLNEYVPIREQYSNPLSFVLVLPRKVSVQEAAN